MTPSAGAVLIGATLEVDTARLDAVAAAIGTATARRTALILSFFGPTVAGEAGFLDALGIDVSRATMGEHHCTWRRPFREDESVDVEVTLDRIHQGDRNRLYVVRSDFTGPDAQLIQRQTTTFVERGR